MQVEAGLKDSNRALDIMVGLWTAEWEVWLFYGLALKVNACHLNKGLFLHADCRICHMMSLMFFQVSNIYL